MNEQPDAAATPVTRGEMLSRLMDDDLTEFEARRMLADLAENAAEDLATWHRFHAIGAVLRGEQPAVGALDLSARVRDAVASESAHEVQEAAIAEPRSGRSWGGLAIAASVALMAVFLVRSIDSGNSNDAATETVAQAPAQGAPARQPTGTLAASQAPATGQPVIIRANGIENVQVNRRPPQPHLYLVRHAEFSSFAGSGGMMPYARVASSDSAE